MMNSYRRNDARRPLIAVTALVVFLFLADLLSGGVLRHAAHSAAAEVSRTVNAAASAVGASGIFATRASLEAQNRVLSQQLAALQERAAAYSVLAAENDQLRTIANLPSRPAGITAPVVSSVIASPYGTFLIGAGSADGVRSGSIVLAGSTDESAFVIGTVSDVGAHTSTVQETFAPGATLDTVIAAAAVSIEGSGGGNAHALIPRGVHVVVGDAVMAPGLGARAVGIVGNIASSSASATQDLSIRVPVNIGALQFVYVVSF